MPELGDDGRVRRVARTLEVRVPPGTTDGRKLRLRERGGKGVNGGRDGDVYLHIAIRPDALFRVSGRDLGAFFETWLSVEGRPAGYEEAGSARLAPPSGSRSRHE